MILRTVSGPVRRLGVVLCALGAVGTADAAPQRLRLDNGIVAVIHRPEDLEATQVVRSGGGAQLVVTDRLRYDLVTDIDDPAIANRGDGRFHPMSVDAVVAALAAVRLENADLEVQVFVLPYPRRAILDSSARDGMMFLTPGTRPVSPYAVHFTVTHELGHVFQYRWMPDRDTAAWRRYAELRGIADAAVFHAGGQHRDRPHEIFAEDFRYLFGGQHANYSGSIENDTLPMPDAIAGLAEFMRDRSAPKPAGTPVAVVSVAPNPFNPSTEVRVDLAQPAQLPLQLGVYDAQGREVRRLFDGTPASRQLRVVWDGRAASGAPVASGVYFAHVDLPAASTSTKMLLVR
jgi:hypothetical protein